jgi:hypothetical protein
MRYLGTVGPCCRVQVRERLKIQNYCKTRRYRRSLIPNPKIKITPTRSKTFTATEALRISELSLPGSQLMLWPPQRGRLSGPPPERQPYMTISGLQVRLVAPCRTILILHTTLQSHRICELTKPNTQLVKAGGPTAFEV